MASKVSFADFARDIFLQSPDPSTTWPPPDPDRIIKRPEEITGEAFTHDKTYESDQARLQAFRERQEKDLIRRRVEPTAQKRRPFYQRFDDRQSGSRSGDATDEPHTGEEGWRDSDGSRLKDFGVDEDAEFYDEDDVPLAQLIRQRRMKAQ